MRRRGPALLATQVTAERAVHMADGTARWSQVGDWIIGRSEAVVEVLSPPAFAALYEPIEPGLEIPQSAFRRIEATLGLGTTRSAAELLDAIDRVARLQIGDVRIDFTPGQLAEMQHRATKRGYTLAQEVGQVIDRIKEELFYGQRMSSTTSI